MALYAYLRPPILGLDNGNEDGLERIEFIYFLPWIRDQNIIFIIFFIGVYNKNKNNNKKKKKKKKNVAMEKQRKGSHRKRSELR